MQWIPKDFLEGNIFIYLYGHYMFASTFLVGQVTFHQLIYTCGNDSYYRRKFIVFDRKTLSFYEIFHKKGL